MNRSVAQSPTPRCDWLILCGLSPGTVAAQDLSGLVLLTLPAFMLTPVILAFGLRSLLCRSQSACPGFGRFLLVAIIETLLWILFAAFAVDTYFNERWGATLTSLAITIGVCWFLNSRLLQTAEQHGLLMPLLLILPVPFVLVLLLAVSYLIAVLFQL